MNTIATLPSLVGLEHSLEDKYGDKFKSHASIKSKDGDLELLGRFESLMNRNSDLSDKAFERAVKTGRPADLFAAQRALDVRVATHEWLLTYVSVLQKSADRLAQMNQ